MRTELKWTVGVGLVASLVAGVLVAAVTRTTFLSLVGWVFLIEILQLPLIASARRGQIDPCTAWLRRTLQRKQGSA